MFSTRRRAQVAGEIIDRARGDDRVVAMARTGSLAGGTGDGWSDVDLFLGVDPASAVAQVVEDLSTWSYAHLGVLHRFDLHVDLPGGAATYRALLLGDGLEVDLGVAGAGAFATVGGEPFEVVFDDRAARDGRAGTGQQPEGSTAPPARADRIDHLVGLAWHHALHARTATARAQPLQAEHWISALRGHATTLAALRHGLPADHAKGADRLPPALRRALATSLVTSMDVDELARAREAAVAVFLAEVEHVDAEVAARLRPVIAGSG